MKVPKVPTVRPLVYRAAKSVENLAGRTELRAMYRLVKAARHIPAPDAERAAANRELLGSPALAKLRAVVARPVGLVATVLTTVAGKVAGRLEAGAIDDMAMKMPLEMLKKRAGKGETTEGLMQQAGRAITQMFRATDDYNEALRKKGK